MDKKDLIFFKHWFSKYCKSFDSPNREVQKNFELKQVHTCYVCENIIRLAKKLLLNENDILLAETIALFHDIGRFPQYDQFKTFKDNKSVNHALYGVKTLIDNRILQHLPEVEQELITQSVKFHNALRIPKNQDQKIAFYLKLIRDADKLDIWRIFLNYCESPEEERASAVSVELPDREDYTKELITYHEKKQIPSYSALKTFNDYKIMLLLWIYDLNFSATFDEMRKQDYINRIAWHLPQNKDIRNMVASLNKYVSQKLDRPHIALKDL